MRVRNPIIALLALAVLAPALAPAPAEATVPPTKCGKIKANGKKFKVRGHRVGCDFARRWSKRFLKRGKRPTGWSCRRYPPKQTKIAFTCRKGGKDYYAIRT
jgi:hypothetical protein